jgi:hypothetical protein
VGTLEGKSGPRRGGLLFFWSRPPGLRIASFYRGKDLEINAGEISTGWKLCAMASTDASPWSSQEHVHLIVLMAVSTSFPTSCFRGEWESGRVGEWESGRVGEWESGIFVSGSNGVTGNFAGVVSPALVADCGWATRTRFWGPAR